MSIFEMRLIIDNIERFGGYREQEVLKNLVKIELIMDTKDYKVYHFEDIEGNYFEYDLKSHRITN